MSDRVTTASGLQYEILASGDGATPGPTDVVSAHYHGTFEDGRVFDSSVERGEPLDLPVNGVIAGWTEALLMMQEGYALCWTRALLADQDQPCRPGRVRA